jgi:hypothetical protein
MLKLTSLFLFVIFFTATTLPAQTLEKAPPVPQSQQISQINADLKQLFKKETENIKKQGSAIDPKKMEKAARQSMKNGLTSKEKTFLILFIAGMAVLVFLVIKYYKKCIRYENDCDPAFNDNCYCEEYEQEEQSREALIPNNALNNRFLGQMPGIARKFTF